MAGKPRISLGNISKLDGRLALFFYLRKKSIRLKLSINKYLIALAFGLGFFLLHSCKERTVTKADLIPVVDNIHTFNLPADSLAITLSSALFDSVSTNTYTPNQSPIIGIGKIQFDPFFGNLSEGLYIQFVPPNDFHSFPSLSLFTFDSAVIALPYSGFSYGDTSMAASNFQGYKVYRVTDPMSINDSSVYTFTDFAYDPTAIGGGDYSLQRMKDSFTVGNDTLAGQLRIKLNTNYILNNIIQLDSSYFIDMDKFVDYFKGWYIAPVSSSSSQKDRISYFTLAGSSLHQTARVDFYFHDGSGTVKIFSFPYGLLSTAYANRIKRDFQNAPASNFIAHNIDRDSILIQGYPGFYTQITLRNINKIPPCVINKAQLVLTALPVGRDNDFFPPTNILLEKVNEDGQVTPIQDILGATGSPSTGGLNFMDGHANKVIINGQEYTQYILNFPRELQTAILAGKDSLTLRISCQSIYAGGYRLVAPGFGNAQDKALKLDIIYTKTN